MTSDGTIILAFSNVNDFMKKLAVNANHKASKVLRVVVRLRRARARSG
jgi:hypothetical protein